MPRKFTTAHLFCSKIHGVRVGYLYYLSKIHVPFFRSIQMETERTFLSILMGVICLLVSCASISNLLKKNLPLCLLVRHDHNGFLCEISFFSYRLSRRLQYWTILPSFFRPTQHVQNCETCISMRKALMTK